ncbi:MAG: NAD(P)H-dependent oxidoreductase [Cyanobacteria bacterium P01_A01_bin.83]
MKLLEIQSSARQQGSISRLLSQEFIETWKNHYPIIEHKQRDVGNKPPAHITELWTKANYLDPEQRTPEMIATLDESENLIEELFQADYLLLGIPMYNFSVPATFKVYIDNIVRINRTFTFEPETHSFQGLLTGKKALIITPSAGNFTPGTSLGAMNFCETYLRALLNFIGIEDINIVSVPNQFMSNEIRDSEIEAARVKLNNLATNW